MASKYSKSINQEIPSKYYDIEFIDRICICLPVTRVNPNQAYENSIQLRFKDIQASFSRQILDLDISFFLIFSSSSIWLLLKLILLMFHGIVECLFFCHPSQRTEFGLSYLLMFGLSCLLFLVQHHPTLSSIDPNKKQDIHLHAFKLICTFMSKL